MQGLAEQDKVQSPAGKGPQRVASARACNGVHTPAPPHLKAWKLGFCSPTRATYRGINVPGTFYPLRVRFGHCGSGSVRAGRQRKSIGAGCWKPVQTEARERAYKGGPRGSEGPLRVFATVQLPSAGSFCVLKGML